MQNIHSIHFEFGRLLSKFILQTSDFTDFNQIYSAELRLCGLFLRSTGSARYPGSAKFTWPKENIATDSIMTSTFWAVDYAKSAPFVWSYICHMTQAPHQLAFVSPLS